MFTKLIKKTGIAALLVLSAFLLAGGGHLWASASETGTGTHNAVGTYTWNAATGVLTLNWTSSDFTCDGPESPAEETKTGVTVTATTMTWASDDGMTWTRSTGTEGDIVSAWTVTEGHTGNSYTLTFNTDGTVSVTGVIVQCGDSGGGDMDPFQAFSSHDFSGYYAHVFVNDPSPAIYSGVNVTGPGLPAQGVNLVYNNGQWWPSQGPILSLGSTLPTTFPSFHIVATKIAGGTDTYDRTISEYVTDFVTVTAPLPSATINTAPTFSWTWPGATSPQWYGINVVDNTTSMPVWSNYNIPGNQTSVNYTGPALTSGHQYNYSISAGIGPNNSMVNGTFTFNTGSGGATISLSGTLNGVGGQPISGALIEQVGNAAIITSTDGDGNFTLNGLPAGTNFTVKMSADNYVPSYTQQWNVGGNIGTRTYQLFTQNDLTNWGVISGGVIRGRVADGSNAGTNNLTGAMVTFTTSNPSPNYAIKYQRDDGTLVDGPGTFANGVYLILNVQEGDVVQVSAAKPGYAFPSMWKTFITHAGGVSLGNITGNPPAGTVTVGGYLQSGSGVGLGGALVEAINEAGTIIRSTMSQGPDGVYSLPVPAGTNFYLRFSKTDYYSTYTAVKNISQYFFDDITKSYNLIPSVSPDQFDSTHWNVAAGQGVIRARVKDQSGNFVDGATVTYTSSLGNNPNTPTAYPIFYADDCNATTFTSTQPGSGRYCIKNVAPGDTVTVTAQKESWTFNSPIFHVNSGGVFQGSVIGTLLGVDDGLIRDGFAALVTEFNKGAGANIDTIMTFFSVNYLNDGRDYNAEKADMQASLNSVPFRPISGVITGLTVTGNTATMTVDMGDKIETMYLAKEGDGVWRVIGNQARHEVWISSQHWQNGYSANISVADKTGITEVTVSGPGISSGTASLTSHCQNGCWWFDGNGPSWTTQPEGPQTFNITVYEGATPYSYQRTITEFVTDFAVPTSPSGSFGSPVVFTWRGIAGATEYSVELNTDQWQRVWSKYNIPGNQWLAIYDGQEQLVAGNTYNFNIVARKSVAGGDGYSFASGTFTYTGNSQLTVTYTGNVFDKDNVLATAVLVEQAGGPFTSSTISDASGGFVLGNIMKGVPSAMKLSKAGYVPSYRHYQARGGNADFSESVGGARSPRIYTEADLSAWGVAAGKGIILGHVEDANSGNNPVAEATISVMSALGRAYTVKYCDATGANCWTTGVTDSSGNFMVMDVEEGDMVVVSAQKTGLNFSNPAVWATHGGSVHIGWVRSTAAAPAIGIFYSETEFNAATLPTRFINFEDRDTSAGRISFAGSEYAGITFSSPVSAPLWVYPPNIYNYWNSKHLSPGNAPYQGGDNDADSLTLLFNPAITAIGWNFLDYGSVNNESIRVYAADNSLIYENNDLSSIAGGGVGQGNNPFWGISSPAKPIARVEIIETAGDGDDVAYDNFRFSPVGQVVTNVAIGGYIRDKSTPGVGIGGVTVEVVGATPALSTTSAGDGYYSLSVPSGIPFHLKFSKDGFAPTYTADMRHTIDNFGLDFVLIDTATFTGWAVPAGKGIIRTRVRDQSGNLMDGVTVTAFSRIHSAYGYYQVCYDDACTLSATDANGRYIIKNLEPDDTVTVMAQREGWTFNGSRVFQIHADGNHQGGFAGTQNAGCSYVINNFPPGPYPVSGMATPYTVSVTAGVGCNWTASTADNWLHITGGAAGSGNGIVNFTVDANSGAARVGTITIASQPFTVDQAAGTTPPASVLVNGDFSNGLNGWTVAPSLGDWNPLQPDGTVSLQPSNYAYMGTVIFQNLNLTNIGGKTINFSLNLTNQYGTSYGKTVAVYLTYYDNANVMHRVQIFNPDNNMVGTNMPFNISYDFPADAGKLVKLEIAKEDYGEFLVDNIGLTGDGIAAGPLPTITGLSANSGPYGSTVTITGNNFGTVPGKVTIRGVSQQINSWTENTINITILDPTPSGHLSVTADFVQSNLYEFDITSPYYSVNLMKNTLKVIKGQKAEFVLNVQTFNNYTTAQGINFTNSNENLNPLSFFTPLPIKNDGGVIMRIDTTNLAAGNYQGNIQANDGSLLATRMVPFTLQVVTVSDIKFYEIVGTYPNETRNDLTSATITRQGYLNLQYEVIGSDGQVIYNFDSGTVLQETTAGQPLLGVYQRFWGYDLYALMNGTTQLTATAPDGQAWHLPVTVNFSADSWVDAVSLQPPVVNNASTEDIVFSAHGTTALGWIGYDTGGLQNFQLSFLDNLVRSGDNLSATSTFNLLNPPAGIGTALLYAETSDGAARAVIPLTTINDPSTGMLALNMRSLDPSASGEMLAIDFYGAADGQLKFSRNVFAMHMGNAPIPVGNIPPGSYKLFFRPGNTMVRSQWWPNAANADSAVPVDLAAGQVAGDIFFFALPVPTDCTYALSPAGPANFSPASGSGSIDVNTVSGCSWTASTMANWLHIVSGSAGNGSGNLNYTVDANTGTARTATITIAGQSFTVNQAEAVNLVQNGDFGSGLNGWTVAPSLGDWNPLQTGGMVSLDPPAAGYSGYLGTVIFQNLNLTNIAGKRINFFLNLTNQYAMSSGKTIAVYLTYYDNANVMHRVKIFSPDNNTIGTNTPFNISYDFPVDAGKLVKLEIVKEDYGEFLVDNIGLTGDGIAAGPLPTITGLSANSGPYGSAVTITGNNFGTVPGKVAIRGVHQQINSWSDNSINITILDPTASGHLSVTADFVQSNRYEFDITSPYYSVNLMKNNFKVIKGQKAEFVLNVQTFNNYTTAQGINFTNSNADLNAFFTPLPIRNSGGLIMRIDTTNLAAGTYQGNIQANDGGNLATRTVPFNLQVVTVTDIKFYDSTYDYGSGTSTITYYSQKDVSRQGSIDFGIWNIEATASDGSLMSGVPFTFTGYDPALIGIYRGNSGMVDFYAEGANGQTSVNVVAPDGFTKAIVFDINIPATPRITSLGLSPALVTNKYADPISFSAAGTQSITYGRYGTLNIKEDTRSFYDEGRSAGGTFKLDLATLPEPGTYLFNASIYGASYPAAAEKVVPLTITNDPSSALMKGGIRSVDPALAPYYLEHFTLEFYNALGVKEFSRDYSGFMHYEEPNFAIGAIPPGTYRIKFVAGNPMVKSQWWPNADNMTGALPVTFVAGGVREDYYFFAALAPTISFAGSVRDSAGNPIANASVYVTEFSSSWAWTDTAGNFILNGIPAGQPFTINLWKSGYVETYSGTLTSPGNIQAPGSFTLLTTAEVSPWQVGEQNLWQAGKGMIMSRVVESGNPAQAVGGAQISITSAMGKTYGITYFDGATFVGTATAPNGLFYIYGIEAGDTVTVTAFKEGWAFNTNTYEVRADGISEQLLFGTPGAMQTVYYYGAVRDRNGNPVMGATIETLGLDPAIQATSDGVGNFVLSGIPMNQAFHLKISMAGYLPTYTRNRSLQGNDMAAANMPYVLRTAEQVYTGWGVAAEKSVVEGRVYDGQDPLAPGIGGVVITAVGNSNRIYTVTYKDDAGNSRTDRTYGNGRYFVLNADPGDTITVTANKPSWLFPARMFTIHADGISQGGIHGTRTPAGLWGGQDIGREAYGAAGYTWWADASRLTITADTAGPGGTVTSAYHRNENGVVTAGTENSTYSSFTRNADGTYTLWENEDAGLPPQPVRMAISEDGSMIILDGAAKVGDRRFDVLVRMDPNKIYSNTDLSGDYYGLGYEHNANPVTPPDGNGADMAISNITTFNGAGSQTYIGRANSDGQIWTDDQRFTARPYTVNTDGSVSVVNGAFRGHLSGNGNVFGGAASFSAGDAGAWGSYIFLKKGDKVYSTADLAGTWAFAAYGDNEGSTRSLFGTMVCDAAGICRLTEKIMNDDGTTSSFSKTTTLTVGADGRFANAPGSTVPVGAIGNGGRTIIWNLSFDPEKALERRIFVAAKIAGAAASPINNKVWAGTHYDGLTFYGDIVVEDPNHTLTSVTVTGPWIAGGQNLIYRSNTGSWTAELYLGPTAPADSYYTITLQGVTGPPVTVLQRINGGVAELATNLSPTGDRTGKITFDFTRITGADGYSIDLFDAMGNLVWSSGKFLATSFPYDGPPLPSGNYYYAVHSWIGNNCSIATDSFNYTAAVQYPAGDLNHDRQVDLADAIIALRAASGLGTPVLFADGDVNNDGTIGMAEALFAMQTVAGLRVTDHQAAVDGVLASLAAYTTTINNKGAAITPADLLPFFHPAYLDDGLDRNMAAQDDLPDGGVHIDAFTVNKVLFFDNVRKIITAEITFTATVNSIPEIHIFPETFAYDQTTGKWLRFGNQRIGEFSVWLGKSREMPAAGVPTDTFVFHPHFTAPPNTVSQVAVSGPALGGTVIYGNPRSETENGITIERFHMTSQGGTDINFSQPVPALGDTYTMAVTKKTGGVVTYTQVMKEVLLDAPTITSPASHELTAANIGSPLSVTWTLPSAGIGLEEIRLEGQVCSTATCQHVEGTTTSLTTGTITLPNIGTSVSSAYIDVRIHKGGEVFTNCRFEFGN